MTATTTAAAHAWNALVAGDWNAMQACDAVMDADGCERAAALVKLHEAAADWLDTSKLDRSWTTTPNAVLRDIRAGVHLDFCESDIASMLRCEKNCSKPLRAWIKWCRRANRALARLRELTAIPGGES